MMFARGRIIDRELNNTDYARRVLGQLGYTLQSVVISAVRDNSSSLVFLGANGSDTPETTSDAYLLMKHVLLPAHVGIYASYLHVPVQDLKAVIGRLLKTRNEFAHMSLTTNSAGISGLNRNAMKALFEDALWVVDKAGGYLEKGPLDVSFNYPKENMQRLFQQWHDHSESKQQRRMKMQEQQPQQQPGHPHQKPDSKTVKQHDICHNFQVGRCSLGSKGCPLFHPRKVCDKEVQQPGSCPSGVNCSFSHNLDMLKKSQHNNNSGETSSRSSRRSDQPSSSCRDDESCKSSEICHYFQEGRCKYGIKCRLSHPQKPCKNQRQQGSCPYGLNCKDSHNPHVLAQSLVAGMSISSHGNSGDSEAHRQQQHADTCLNFQVGRCSLGDKCKHFHPSRLCDQEQRQRGGCPNGINCALSHNPDMLNKGPTGNMGGASLAPKTPAQAQQAHRAPMSIINPKTGKSVKVKSSPANRAGSRV